MVNSRKIPLVVAYSYRRHCRDRSHHFFKHNKVIHLLNEPLEVDVDNVKTIHVCVQGVIHMYILVHGIATCDGNGINNKYRIKKPKKI